MKKKKNRKKLHTLDLFGDYNGAVHPVSLSASSFISLPSDKRRIKKGFE